MTTSQPKDAKSAMYFCQYAKALLEQLHIALQEAPTTVEEGQAQNQVGFYVVDEAIENISSAIEELQSATVDPKSPKPDEQALLDIAPILLDLAPGVKRATIARLVETEGGVP
jgi:hypothetical protein